MFEHSGFTSEQSHLLLEAQELEALYDFPPMFSKIAYELFEKKGVALKDAFEFLDILRDYGGDFDDSDIDSQEQYKGLSPEESLRKTAFDPYIQFMYFECGLSPGFAYDFYNMMPCSQAEIMKFDPKLLRAYAQIRLDAEIRFEPFKEAYEYYQQKADESYNEENYEEYMDLICSGRPKEVAFDVIVPFGNYDDCEDFCGEEYDESEYDSIEQMAEEEEKWHGIQIDGDQ